VGNGKGLAATTSIAMNNSHSTTERISEADRWQRLKTILADALEQESPVAQIALVERSCANDLDLLREAESLLFDLQTPGLDWADDLEECAENAPTRPGEDVAKIGERIGAYIILRQIGQGGMGAVFLAARADGCFEKQVAIKLLTRGGGNTELVRRFRSEREVLAHLDHPNIARLIDAGTTDDGRLYFVMEHIDGIPITEFVAEKQLPLTARLELFLKTSAAVEAAHRHSIIHRDLKPSNILVNSEGEPKLLDFGIAKPIGDTTDRHQQTVSGCERLTPVFASPEQVRGEAVTLLSDVYSLGVVFYEMLTGTGPFQFESDRPSNVDLIQILCQQPPTPPSLAVSDRHQRQMLAGDLDAILLRALQKEPAFRYLSVAEFSEDIRRFLQRKPVLARSGDKLYHVWRTFSLNRRWHLGLAVVGLGIACYLAWPQRRIQISLPEGEVISAGGTADVIAERRFVQAWQLIMRGSEPDAKESLLQATSLLNEAVARDPNFSRAYDLLVTAHLDLYWQGFDHTPARRDLARVGLEKMAQLNLDPGEMHLERAKYLYNGFRDYERALSELAMARPTQQNRASLYVFYASIYRRMGRWNEAIQNFNRAIELGPTNFRYRLETAFTYEGLRQYSEARKFYERSLTIAPHNYFARSQAAQISFYERGDLEPVRSELNAILKEDPKAATEIANALFNSALAGRDPIAMQQALQAIRAEGLRDICNNSLSTRDWCVGLAARAFGDIRGAHVAFAAARTIEEKNVRDQPDYAPAWSRLGLIDAGLGRKEDAIHEGRRACELLPLSRDAWDGAGLMINLAMIYAWTGEPDLAIEQLSAAAKIPAGLTYGELKLYPQWDSLRSDPRFQKILASLAPK
jgi:serine/threonine protein kinase/Flp pilus assembly protein TadD